MRWGSDAWTHSGIWRWNSQKWLLCQLLWTQNQQKWRKCSIFNNWIMNKKFTFWSLHNSRKRSFCVIFVDFRFSVVDIKLDFTNFCVKFLNGSERLTSIEFFSKSNYSKNWHSIISTLLIQLILEIESREKFLMSKDFKFEILNGIFWENVQFQNKVWNYNLSIFSNDLFNSF